MEGASRGTQDLRVRGVIRVALPDPRKYEKQRPSGLVL